MALRKAKEVMVVAWTERKTNARRETRRADLRVCRIRETSLLSRDETGEER
jgi:hypothetical protein